MKRRNWLTGGALIGTLALTLTACSAGSEPEPTATSGPPSGTLTIETNTNYSPVLETIAEQFEEEYPDVTVEVTGTDNASLQTTLRTKLAAGTAADIFTVFPGIGDPIAMMQLQPSGYLADLTDLDFNSKLPASLDNTTTVDGKRYMLPYTAGGIGALFNQTVMDEIGLTAPTTWSDLIAFCNDARDAGKVAFAYPAQTGWINLGLPNTFSATLVYGADPDFMDDMYAGDATFEDSEGWVQTLERILEMQDGGCFQEAPLGTAYEVAAEMVATGDALAMATVTSSAPAIVPLAPAGTEIVFRTLPATENADDTWAIGGAIGGHGVNAAAKNPTAARAFMEFMASDEMQTVIADASGALPIIQPEGFEVPASLQDLDHHLQDGTAYPNIGQLFPNPETNQALQEGIQQLLGGQSSVEDVLRAMDAAWARG